MNMADNPILTNVTERLMGDLTPVIENLKYFYSRSTEDKNTYFNLGSYSSQIVLLEVAKPPLFPNRINEIMSTLIDGLYSGYEKNSTNYALLQQCFIVYRAASLENSIDSAIGQIYNGFPNINNTVKGITTLQQVLLTIG